ncbi:MAG: ABC transporter ATP-binding protein [Pyrinomonadaceae bacterium]|nr:ABC transporter ATP-binding protein [Pyrinomonadaceae bacterium]
MPTSRMSKVQPLKPQIDGRTIGVQGRDTDGHWRLDFRLSVTDLRKSFLDRAGERLEVLRGVSFGADAGEAVAIMGASGAGKSTLQHLVAGLEEPDHGRIALGPLEITSASPATLAKFRSNHIGLVFQFHHLLSDLNAAENVALPLMIARKGRREAMTQAIQSLGNLALGSRVAQPVGQLSGGEQQRVAVCRALITQPSLVIADEPTGNLDASFAGEIGETLVAYARSRGAIVLLATHNERLAQLCDRILVLKDGRLH